MRITRILSLEDVEREYPKAVRRVVDRWVERMDRDLDARLLTDSRGPAPTPDGLSKTLWAVVTAP